MKDCKEKEDMNKTSAKYAIGILCAVTLVVGAMAGGLVTAAEDAEINEFANMFSIDNVQERLESKGFDVTVEDETITAYRERPGRTMTMTIQCPDRECAQPEPPEGQMPGNFSGGMGPGTMKHFRFRAGTGPAEDPEAFQASFQAKLEQMGVASDEIEAMQARLGEMGVRGFNRQKGCPFAGGSTE